MIETLREIPTYTDLDSSAKDWLLHLKSSDSAKRSLPQQGFIYLLVGISVGLLSGIFGVGGGLIAVPIMLYVLHFEHRLAVGTSLLAIFFPVCAGASSYFWHGYYSLPLALTLALGSLVGVQIGSKILQKVSIRAVQYGFITLNICLCISLALVLPQRNISFELSLSSGIIVFTIGVLAGFIAGLLGIGGGGVVIPLLILIFGMSDLVAKGSALLMMIVTSLSGTFSNIRYGKIDYFAAAMTGITAALFAPVGAYIAATLSPLLSNILFIIFLLTIMLKMFLELRIKRQSSPSLEK